MSQYEPRHSASKSLRVHHSQLSFNRILNREYETPASETSSRNLGHGYASTVLQAAWSVGLEALLICIFLDETPCKYPEDGDVMLPQNASKHLLGSYLFASLLRGIIFDPEDQNDNFIQNFAHFLTTRFVTQKTAHFSYQIAWRQIPEYSNPQLCRTRQLG
jgi:hypothetical protein